MNTKKLIRAVTQETSQIILQDKIAKKLSKLFGIVVYDFVSIEPIDNK